jgi:hypothetical protein
VVIDTVRIDEVISTGLGGQTEKMLRRQFDNFVEVFDKIVEYTVIPLHTKALHGSRMNFDKIVELIWTRRLGYALENYYDEDRRNDRGDQEHGNCE